MNGLDLLPRVAYFSMEIAVDEAIPTYSGGLGVLAGDMMRSAADLAVPLVGVTTVSRRGYFRQGIVNGRQLEYPQDWDPATFAKRLDAKVRVRIGDREVALTAWEYTVGSRCRSARPVPVLMLDTDLPENDDEDRSITDMLYGGDDTMRLRQEIVLGVGGVRMLEALGWQVHKYHLNEGHAAFLALELLREQMASGASASAAIAAVQKRCVFTTHTPVATGHDQFDYGVAGHMLAGLVDHETLRSLAGEDKLNMTRLALHLSGWINGVAQRHAETSRSLFPGYEVHAITNGVHPWTWASDPFRTLYDKYVPHWCQEPEVLIQATRIPLEELVSAHAAAKRSLAVRALQAVPGTPLDPERLTIGFARRMTDYKRPHLLFTDLPRLRSISAKYPLQVVLAGKAHPHDEQGKRHIVHIHQWARELAPDVRVAFLPDYGMAIAREMVAGVDVWLNTPQRPMEASGTSGMKAALNGVPSFSVLDGWWVEGCAEGLTGWSVGDESSGDNDKDAASLYDKLEHTIAPLYYENRRGWQELIRSVVTRNAAYFNSHRMLRRYVLEAYSR